MDPDFDYAALQTDLAGAARNNIFLGTSSWKYPGWLHPEYFAMLAERGVTHVFNSWAGMPPVSEQWSLPGSLTTPERVAARLLLKPGRRYQEAVDAFQPYDRLKEPLPEVREAAAAIIRQSRPTRRRTYLYVNNRLEGNAPRTIAAVLAMAGVSGVGAAGAAG